MADIQMSIDNSVWYTFNLEFQNTNEKVIKKGAAIELLNGSTHFDLRAIKRVFGYVFQAMHEADYQNLLIVFNADLPIYLKVPTKAGGTTTYVCQLFSIDGGGIIRPYGSGGDWARSVTFELEEI